MEISPESVVGTFASIFLTDIMTGNIENAAKPFFVETPSCSILTHVYQGGETIITHQGKHITSGLTAIAEHFANGLGAEVTHLAATDVSFGVHGTALVTVSTPEAHHVVQLTVLLEQFNEYSYFVRAMTFTILQVEPIAAPVAEEIAAPVVEEAVPEPAPAVVEPVVEVVVTAEEPVVKPKKGKGKGKKTEEVAAPVQEEVVAETAAPAEAPVEEAVAPVEAAAPVERRPESPAPTGSKSWATLAASKPAAVPKAAPVRVAPPTKEEPVAEAPVATSKKSNARAAAPRYDGAGDKLVFTVQAAVTDDQILAALGKWSKQVVSLRNVSDAHQRVFVDFSAEGVLEDLKDKVTIGGHKAPVFRQKPKE